MTQEELIDKLLELTSAPSGSKLAAATSEAASSFMSGFSRLWGGASSGTAASSADPKHVWLPIAKHLQRIAGNQVRFLKCAKRRLLPFCAGKDLWQAYWSSLNACRGPVPWHHYQEVTTVALCRSI